MPNCFLTESFVSSRTVLILLMKRRPSFQRARFVYKGLRLCEAPLVIMVYMMLYAID